MNAALRAVARLAWRDAWAHRLRTFMALILVALPVLALAAFCAVGLGLAWALGRPARELVVRRMD